ncbi:MAG: class I SAM-dependent methyltransferase [Acidaminococcales bacterium]|jgi:2-polyprenyl-3-methyl-5-hydroxy-6-metoxy-1,4-benzoquinol methylase|nr:class I SAM-dependent methyltransferase [Acidaminococcales bacterium]
MRKIPFAEKYHTGNPIYRYLISHFIQQLIKFTDIIRPSSILELGCGEGFLAIPLAQKGYRVRGIDLREDAVEFARKRSQKVGLEHLLSFEFGDINHLDLGVEYRADLVICCEVLEHLESPNEALCTISRLAPNAVLSVPREPLWRILNMSRLKYLTRLGNTPGHINHWSKNEFLRLVGGKFTILDYSMPLPWTMVLCKPID